MDKQEGIQYVSDKEGRLTAVLVPIDLWHELASEKETRHLLRSETMRKRLLEARERRDGVPFEAAREDLGI